MTAAGAVATTTLPPPCWEVKGVRGGRWFSPCWEVKRVRGGWWSNDGRDGGSGQPLTGERGGG